MTSYFELVITRIFYFYDNIRVTNSRFKFQLKIFELVTRILWFFSWFFKILHMILIKIFLIKTCLYVVGSQVNVLIYTTGEIYWHFCLFSYILLFCGDHGKYLITMTGNILLWQQEHFNFKNLNFWRKLLLKY